jgi:SAM-dependent methyltransferase
MRVSSAEYWNDRLDALDWKRRTRRSSRAAWSRACRTFLSPATVAGLDALGELHHRSVLELGAGHGQGAVHLVARGANVTALDISSKRCAEGQRQLAGAPAANSIRFCAARAEALPFASASFDRVFARDVLMYADPKQIVRESLRVIAPGGVVVFVESLAGPGPLGWFRQLTSPREYREFTRHLNAPELSRLAAPLKPEVLSAHYLISLIAFAALFVLRSPKMHSWLLSRLYPLDRWLLERVPCLRRWAWRGVVAFRKPLES